MKKLTKVTISVLGCVIGLCGLDAFAQDSFYKKHKEGWFWYKDLIFEEESPEATKEAPILLSPHPLPQSEIAKRRVETMQKELTSLRMTALEFPTRANLEKYMRLQKSMMEKAETFSKVWQEVVLMTPSLNPEVKNPTAAYARASYYEKEKTFKENAISALSKTHGLLYVFKSQCAYCTKFAPVVKLFAQKYNWQVMAISADGGMSETFPKAFPDNGIVHSLHIQSVPALIAFNSETNEVIPISYAMTSLEQLENNVMTLIHKGGTP